MTEKECKWLKDEFCVNDKCPMCADYCPTAQYPGVCKYEELVDVQYSLTPQGCLAAALTECGIDVTKVDINKLFTTFENLMVREGNIQVVNKESEEPTKPVEFNVGQVVTLDEILASGQWELECAMKDFATYVTKDHVFLATFTGNSDKTTATIYLNR